jgi:hypothetical protein
MPRLSTSILSAAILCGALACAVPGAHAQWLKYKAPGIPRLPDGKPDLNAPAPKTADGKPDIAGLWLPPNPANYLIDLTKTVPAGEVVMTRWAEELYRHRRATESKDDPTGYCVPGGIPRSYLPPYPYKIVNTPGEVIMMFEAVHSYRQIFTDGRQLPKDPNPTWMGYSVGRWENDTFVIESSGFRDEAWLDNNGHPSSDALHVTERLRRKDFGHMDVEVTIDDPKAYKKPWKVTLPLTLDPDNELIEYVCSENEKDLQHLVGK